MAYTLHEENILNNLKDYFKDNLSVQLSGIAAQIGDGVKLPMFKEFIVGEADIFKMNRYPGFLLFPELIEYEYLHAAADSLNMTVDCVLVLKGAKTENLVTKSLRYVGAFRDLVDSDRTANSAVDRCSVERVRYHARVMESYMVTEVVLATMKEIIRS